MSSQTIGPLARRPAPPRHWLACSLARSLAHSVDLLLHLADSLVVEREDLVALLAVVVAFGRDLACRLGDADDLSGRGADRPDALRVGIGVDHPFDQLLDLVLLVVAVVRTRLTAYREREQCGERDC